MVATPVELGSNPQHLASSAYHVPQASPPDIARLDHRWTDHLLFHLNGFLLTVGHCDGQERILQSVECNLTAAGTKHKTRGEKGDKRRKTKTKSSLNM